MAFKPTICVDFDGVLHSYTSGWKGAGVIPDAPTPGALEWLARVLFDGRFNVAIYSSRSSSLAGRMAMKVWLFQALKAEFGGDMGPNWEPLSHEIRDWIKWPWFKPAALITIDDRALTFSGNWSEYAPDDLMTFKPWNKRSPPPMQQAPDDASGISSNNPTQ